MKSTKRRGSTGQNLAFSTMIPNTSAAMKYRPSVEPGRSATRGTKPLPNPVTIPEVFTKVTLHFCKRYLYVRKEVRITAYAILLFFISLITDYMPLPRSYFSNTKNVFNQYFVKFSWAWTISLVGSFIYLTASVYCGSQKRQIGRQFVRLLVGTIIWYTFTNIIVTVDDITGKCIYTGPGGNMEAILSKGRRPCLKNGGKWTGFDISGHTFLLIFCVLLIIEETKPIINWDSITNHIQNEEHKRSSDDKDLPDTCLSSLTDEEYLVVKTNYKNYGNWAKVLVVLLTALVFIWDLMILMTACYFHTMIEKVIGGLLGIIMWILTYRLYYKANWSLSPGLPGSGIFKYSNHQFQASTQLSKPKSTVNASDDIPTFMGMPRYDLRNSKSIKSESSATRDVLSKPQVPSK